MGNKFSTCVKGQGRSGGKYKTFNKNTIFSQYLKVYNLISALETTAKIRKVFFCEGEESKNIYFNRAVMETFRIID